MAKFMKIFSKLFVAGEMDGKIKNREKITGTGAKKVKDRDGQEAENSVGEKKMKAKDSTEELKNKGKLFIGGLSYQTTSKGLENYFSQFGQVIDAIVMRYPDSGRSRGFGFVMFADVSDAKSALCSNPHVLDGKNIDVRPFVPSEPASNTSKKKNDCRVFLGGLPECISSDVLKQFFGRYGEISRIVIPLDKHTKKPKGFGFIWFKNEEAAEKCLAEDFVHLWGRRIHIKKAEPRTSSQVPDSTDAAAETCPDYQEAEDFSLKDLLFWDGKSTSYVVDNETSSEASGERSEEDLKVKSLLEDFLSPKLSNFDAMNETKAGEEEGNFEKLLAEFLVKCNNEYSTSDENLISFSDDSEFEESIHFDCDSDVSSNDCEADGENETSALDKLNTEFIEMLRGDSLVRGTEILDLNNGGSGDGRDFQTSVPFNFRDNNGSLLCPLCQWAPEDNSCESFLVHCKTAFHRMKLKDRFPREQPKVIQNTEQIGKTESRLKPCPTKPLAMTQQETSKSQDRIQAQGKREKQTTKTQKALIAMKDVMAKGGNVEIKSTPSNSNPEENKNKNCEVNSIKRLKMKALAKGMSCIRPMSDEQLRCNMCNKIIPRAPDFNVVMKNVSDHLQSKGHLKKLLETENLLKESLENKQEKAKCCNIAKNPPGQQSQSKASFQEQKLPNEKTQGKVLSQKQKIPNQKTQGKASSQEQKIPNQKTQGKASSQEQKIPNQKTQGKASSQEQKIPGQKTPCKASVQKQKISNQGNVAEDNNAKKSQDKNSDSKLLFLCIPCNYFNKNIEIFKTHLKSESHLNCFISKGVSTDLSLDNLSKCKTCELFLYGSLYYINKHYSKCSEKRG